MKRKKMAMMYAVSLTAAMLFGMNGTAFAQEMGDTEEVDIQLSDEGITVDGEAVSSDVSAAVYAGAEMVYYKAGQDTAYGAGSEEDGHTEEEAAEHTVITITQPGTYRVSGKISKGQIAIDLGKESREDPQAVVNLILDQADITCTAASGIVVYNAYECGSDDTETATKDVDTTAAGFNLILADGTENTVKGSHVAKIYREGTTQADVDAGEAKKQWKFDGAIDSLVSMNIDGEENGNGKLNVIADNEGISSGLHMTINAGEIHISAADDSINTNEDGVSVLTVNGGILICDSGAGAEGDGIDSNGWIVQNGGYVIAYANPDSQDSGVDSDLGIYVNGGTMLASGNMYDEVSGDSGQTFLVLNFREKQEGDQLYMLKNSDDEAVTAFRAVNSFTTMVYSSDLLTDGDYTLYKVSSVTGDLTGNVYTNITAYEGEAQLQYSSTGMMGMRGGFGGMKPGEMPQMPEGMEDGEKPELPEGMVSGEAPELPEGMKAGETPELPEDMASGEAPELPEGMASGEAPGLPEGMEDGEKPELPEGMASGEAPELPEGMKAGEAPELPEGMASGEAPELPEGMKAGEMPGGMQPGEQLEGMETESVFKISGIQNFFSGITEKA